MNRREFIAGSSSVAIAGTVAATTEPHFSLLIAGDIELDNSPGNLIARGGNPFIHVESELAKADVVVGNLECVIATIGQPERKPYTFRAHPRVIPYLQRYFHALSLANNHTGDFGKAALVQCLDLLAQAKLPTFGAGRNLAEAHRPWLVERQGIRAAILGYNEFKPASFAATTDGPGVAWSAGAEGEQRVLRDIQQAKKQADIVIPYLHWGWEDEPANDRQKAFARTLIDAGADAIIGGHPHVTQGYEFYRNKLIVYSLGNFIFDEFKDREGWLAKLFISKKGVLGWELIRVITDEQGTPHIPAERLAGQQPLSSMPH